MGKAIMPLIGAIVGWFFGGIASAANAAALGMVILVSYVWTWSPIAAVLLAIAGPPALVAAPFLLLSMTAAQIVVIVAFPLWLAFFVWRFG